MRRPDKFILCYVTDRRSLDPAADPRMGYAGQVDADDGQYPESAVVRRIESAARAGVDWVQIREKDLPARRLASLTRAAIQAGKPSADEHTAQILVNDRFDVAWAAGAAGVHAGENSLPVRALVEARRASGLADFLVGASCHSLDSALSAAAEGADYIFFGPVFATPSKAAFGSPQGLGRLAEVCRAVIVPVIAIGGITLENARSCRQAGAAGIAAIRLFQADSRPARNCRSPARRLISRLAARRYSRCAIRPASNETTGAFAASFMCCS